MKKSSKQTYSELLNDALNAVLGLQGLVIEVCGAWVWITGNTRDHKDALKAAAFKWANKKKAWYYRPAEYKSRGRGKASLEEIRANIGVSINRPAQDIAADIKRRLLPHYLERYPQTVARFQENKAKEQHLHLITQALQRIAGGRLSHHGRGARSLYFKRGDAEIRRDGQIDLNLRKLTVEQAIKVISVIQNE